MKNKGIIIAIILIVIAVVAYFLLKKKSTDNQTVTTSTESTTGVAQLFNSGAIGSLFGGGKKTTEPSKITTPGTTDANLSTALNISSMVTGFGG